MKYMRGLPDKERFERWLDTTNSCWLWTGSKNPSGGDYGRFRYKGKGYLAHRAAYEIYCGEIPQGMQVLHTCDNPPCVNPAHLFVGTTIDNMQDMTAKGRGKCVSGINHHRAKLNPEKAFEIRWLSAMGRSRRSLALEYEVSKPLIKYVDQHKIWRMEAHD